MANLSNINNKFIVTDGNNGRVLIGATNDIGATLFANHPSTTAPSLTFNAPAGQVFENEDLQIAFGLNNASPYNGYMQTRFVSAPYYRNLAINPLGGDVGIGTNSPGQKLEVSGNTYVTGYVQASSALIGNKVISSVNYATFGSNSTATGVALSRDWNPGTYPDLIINPSGNVGIGATDPLRKLHVVGNMAVNAATTQYYGILMQGGEGNNPSIMIGDWHNSSASIKWDSTGHYLRIDSQHSTANAAILFSGNDGTTEYMRIASTGNVGIGTPNPNQEGFGSANRALSVKAPLSGGVANLELIGLGNNNDDELGYVNFMSQAATNSAAAIVGLRHTSDTSGKLSFRTAGSERMRIKEDGNILVADTRRIQFYNTDQYIGATSTNDLEIGAGDDINYRSNFSRFFSGSAEHARLTGVGSASWVVNGSATHLFGVGLTNPSTKLTVKDSQDSSLYSGLKVERSANTTGVYLNAVGGALNLNTDASMPLKFRIQNSSMQTINTDGGRAYAGFGGWRMFEYIYNVDIANGATVDLLQNTSAHTDLHMVQIAIRMFHSGRTYWVGSGVVGGYGMNLIGSGSGATNGGLTSALVSSGIRKLQITQSSGFTAVTSIYIQFRLDNPSGINVLNGTLSSL